MDMRPCGRQSRLSARRDRVRWDWDSTLVQDSDLVPARGSASDCCCCCLFQEPANSASSPLSTMMVLTVSTCRHMPSPILPLRRRTKVCCASRNPPGRTPCNVHAVDVVEPDTGRARTIAHGGFRNAYASMFDSLLKIDVPSSNPSTRWILPPPCPMLRFPSSEFLDIRSR